ncbi:NUDIX hydrolase [Paenibacillus ehimensis]|uniref:NUDIX hydrolase n=1 Tax=Paenibacillus ehimensis TaxID=79264 RepID=UPI002DBFD372|nr:NUDIX hydrolase [Paenibacillus ehimensis]MEC0208173.1 NUDIX hydrolase [Paenibacillus ehimensis]
MGYIEELRSIVGHRPLIFVGSVVIVQDSRDRILLQQRKHPLGSWGIPGGLMELGETAEDTARRELFEEAGITIGDLELIDVFSGPQNFIKAPNGDEFYVVTIAYATRSFTGTPSINDAESLAFQFFDLQEVPKLVKSHRVILERFLAKNNTLFR